MEDDAKLAIAGEKEAFIRLIRQLDYPMYRMAKAFLKNNEDCADID